MTSILGNGLAANCCAHLLTAAGMPVTIEKTSHSKVPALLIGSATQSLISDVFQRPDIFHGAHQITKRIVAWGENAAPIEIPHSAVVISEIELTRRLQMSLPDTSGEIPDWTIRTVASPEQLFFGTRMATASPVKTREGSVVDACWIESLENGWLFLLPGWLLAVGGPTDELLARSRVVTPQIESLDSPKGKFSAYPRLSDPLYGPGWLACGGGAIAFDPICGDGSGNAIREAILACAVIKASKNVVKRCNSLALFLHYRARLLAGFLKHLELCRQFYTACSGEWWQSELALLDQGIVWCREQLGTDTKFHFQLRGFDLHPISSAAQTLE